jgi:hypothetical protein
VCLEDETRKELWLGELLGALLVRVIPQVPACDPDRKLNDPHDLLVTGLVDELSKETAITKLAAHAVLFVRQPMWLRHALDKAQIDLRTCAVARPFTGAVAPNIVAGYRFMTRPGTIPSWGGTGSLKAGEGIRTPDVQLGRLSLYH